MNTGRQKGKDRMTGEDKDRKTKGRRQDDKTRTKTGRQKGEDTKTKGRRQDDRKRTKTGRQKDEDRRTKGRRQQDKRTKTG